MNIVNDNDVFIRADEESPPRFVEKEPELVEREVL